MSVAFDAAAVASAFAGGSGRSLNITAGAGVNLVLAHVAWLRFPSGTATASATCGGVSMTPIRAATVIATPDGNGYVQTFYLVSPGTGVLAIDATLSASSMYGYFGATTWTGVDTSNPIAASAEATGTSSAPSVSVGSTAGNYCIDTVMSDGATPTATFTQNWNQNDSGIRGASQRTAATGSAVNMAWSGSMPKWAMQAYEIKAAGGGGGNPWYYRAQETLVSMRRRIFLPHLGIITRVPSSGLIVPANDPVIARVA